LCVVCPPERNEKMLLRDEAMRELNHVYEIRPRRDHRGVDLVSDALPFGGLRYSGPDAVGNAIDYAKFYSRSHDAPVSI